MLKNEEVIETNEKKKYRDEIMRKLRDNMILRTRKRGKLILMKREEDYENEDVVERSETK